MANSTSKILIIDDETAIMHSLADYLEDMEYQTLVAENGRIGLKLFEENNVDLVLVDLKMPEVDGFEVLSSIAKSSPETPLIAISGTGNISDAVDALHMGAWNYLLKPIENLSVLSHAVTGALEKSRLKKENLIYQHYLENAVDDQKKELKQANNHLSHVNSRLRNIVNTIRSLSFCSEVNEFGSRLLDEFGRHMTATGGSLYLNGKGGLRLVHSLDAGHAPKFIPHPLNKRSVFQQAICANSSLLINDISKYNEIDPSGWGGYKDGSTLIFPLLDESGATIGVLAIHNKSKPPFTEQDQEIGEILTSYSSETFRAVNTSEHLHESEKQYRELTEMLPVAIFETNIEMILTYVNQRAFKVFGYTREDYESGINAIQMLEPKDRNIAERRISTLLKGKNIQIVEYNGIKKDGSIFPILLHLTAIIRDEQILGIRGIAIDITDRKKNEEALRKSEEQYRQLVESSPMGILSVDHKGNLTNVNAKVLEIMNSPSLDDTMSINIFDFKPLQVIGASDAFKSVIQTGKAFQSETEYTSKWGKTAFMRYNIVPICDDSGNVTGAQAIIEDSTERKLAEVALQQSEENLRTLFEESRDAIYISSRKGSFIDINPSAVELFGYTQEELLSMPVENLHVNSEFRKSMNDDILKFGFIKDYEVQLKRKDGKIIDCLITASLKKDADAEAIGFQGIIRDITMLKKAEDEIKVLARFPSENPNPILRIDKKGILLYANNPAFSMLKEWNLQVGSPIPEVLRNVIDGMGGKPVKRIEIPCGSHFFSISASYSAEADYAYIYADDITEQRIAEKENSKLEVQLRRSQKLETIGTLAGGIAHDFNNILTPIMGFTQMAMFNMDVENPLYKDLEQVINGTYRARDLVNQILLFSKQSEKERFSMSLQPLINEALKLLRPTLPSTIEFNKQIDSTCGNVMADATQIHQIIVNLCTNAWQAMEINGGLMTIKLKQIELNKENVRLNPKLIPGPYACLTISDSGIGMNETTLEYIFEPFFTTKPIDKGTGLGLSVVHGIIRSHQGDIQVSSKPGVGSSFHVYLPIIESELDSKEHETVSLLTGTEYLLVVEDDKTVGRMILRMLESIGYTVDLFFNSPEALREFKKQPKKYDMIITDLTMPDLTGIELSREIQKAYQGIPIIVITGNRRILSKEILQESGIKKVIGKPIDFQEFSIAVRKTLDTNK